MRGRFPFLAGVCVTSVCLTAGSQQTFAQTPAAGAPVAEWTIGHPDLVLTLPEPYPVAAGGAASIRSFVLPSHTTEERHVRAIEFLPDRDGIVHHALIKIDTSGASRRIDAASAGVGFEGGSRSAQFPDGHMLRWTPGQQPDASEAARWTLPAGADVIVELHLTPSGQAESIRPRIGLTFAAERPARRPSVIRLSNQRLDIAPGDAGYIATDKYELPVDVDVVAAYPEAHRLARSLTGTAHLPDGQTLALLALPDWDDRSLPVSRFAPPIHLPRGTTIDIEYRYDNSERNPRNPHHPPRRVSFGPAAEAEMAELWLQVATASADDRTTLQADAAAKMLTDDIAGGERLAAASPNDARLKRELAFAYTAAGRYDEAVKQLEGVLKLNREAADGYYQLGTVLLRQGRLSDAERRFRQAIERQPQWPESHNDLGGIRFVRGDLAGALRAFDAAVAGDATNASAHFNRGRVLVALRRPTEAVAAFARARSLTPRDAEVITAMASATASTGDLDSAVRQYRDALVIAPDLVSALTDLAWLLATAAPRTAPRAAEAVRLAERAATLTQQQVPVVLDTLAVSYFASGRADDAIAAAELALEMAGIRGEKDAAKDIKRRLEMYRSLRNPTRR